MGMFDIITQPYRAVSSALHFARGWYDRRTEAEENKRQAFIKRHDEWMQKLTAAKHKNPLSQEVTHVVQNGAEKTPDIVTAYWTRVKTGEVRADEHAQLQKTLWASVCLTSAPAALAQDRNDFSVRKKTLEDVLTTKINPIEERAPIFSGVARHGKDIAAGAMGFSFGLLGYASVVAHYYQHSVHHLLSSSYGIHGHLADAIKILPQWAAYSADFAPALFQSLAVGIATIPVALAGIVLDHFSTEKKAHDAQLVSTKKLASQGLDAVRDYTAATARYNEHAAGADHKAGNTHHGSIDIKRLDTLSDSVQAAIDSAAATAPYRQAVEEEHSSVPQKIYYFPSLKLRLQKALAGAYSTCVSVCRASASFLL